MNQKKREEIFRWVKVYKIKVSPAISRFWYHKYEGQELYATLIVKTTSDSILKPVFAIVEKLGKTYKPASMPRSIRPEDCTVVSEEIVNSNINKYRNSFE